MRERIEKERTPSGRDHLAIKTGAGGLIDAEFMAQVVGYIGSEGGLERLIDAYGNQRMMIDNMDY